MTCADVHYLTRSAKTMHLIKRLVKGLLFGLSCVWLFPHVCVMRWHPNRDIIRLDLEQWALNLCCLEKASTPFARTHFFIQLMTRHPEYRNLFYYRVRPVDKLLSWLCRPMSTLYLYTDDIGPGLFIQHGFSTIICAKKIGENCWINQQVTIGFSNGDDSPTVGDNVTICAGAKVIGAVSIGDSAAVGANAVVVKDVPKNCTVVGVPAYIVRQDGAKVKKPL